MAPTYSPLAPVSAGLFAVLSPDPALNVLFKTPDGLVSSGVQTDIPLNPVYPLLWIEVMEQAQLGGFGTKPGQGAIVALDIRLHAFSQFHGMAECHAIIARACALLSTSNALSVAGYNVCGTEPVKGLSVPLPDQLLYGVKVDEVLCPYLLTVEELP